MDKWISSTLITFVLATAGIVHGEEVSESEPTITDTERRLLEASLQSDQEATQAQRQFGAATASGRAITPALMNPQISLILDFAAAYFSEDESLQTGAHDPNQTGFNLQQLELHIENRVDPFFDFQTNIVLSLFGVEVEEVYGQTLALPGSLQIRAGQFLLPFGRANPTHPHTWKLLDQPLMLGKFMGAEGGRGLGVELSWLSPLPWFAQLTAVVTQQGGACCSKSFFSSYAEPIDGLDDFIYLTRLEQFWALTNDWSLLLGASYLIGENKSGLDHFSALLGGDLLIRYRPLNSPNRRSVSLQVEWTRRERQRPAIALTDHGGYAELVIRWNQNWDSGLRWEWVDGMPNDDQDLEWSEARMRNSAALTWYPSHFSRLRLQVGHDAPDWLEKPIWSCMLGFEVLVGAHGAHKY